MCVCIFIYIFFFWNLGIFSKRIKPTVTKI